MSRRETKMQSNVLGNSPFIPPFNRRGEKRGLQPTLLKFKTHFGQV